MKEEEKIVIKQTKKHIKVVIASVKNIISPIINTYSEMDKVLDLDRYSNLHNTETFEERRA